MFKMQKSSSVLIVLALVLSLGLVGMMLGAAEPVSAAEFHVTTAAEFQSALDAAETNGEDDVIYLAAGTYEGNFDYEPPDTEHKSLTIRGESGTTASDVILDGQHNGRVLRIYDGDEGDMAEVVVTGITIRNGSYPNGGGGLFVYLFESYNFCVVDCIIISNKGGLVGGGINIQCKNSITLENNLILNNTVTELSSQSRGGGVGIYYGACFIRNNVMAGNTANATDADTEGGALWISSYTNIHLVGNTIYGNQATKGGGVYFNQANNASVYNNIIYGNTANEGGDIYVEGVTSSIGYNNDYSDIFGTWTESGSNIDSDPAFADPASHDYHLTPGSPCIDAGTTAIPDPPGLPTTDIEGNPRVSGAAPDMGAYERGIDNPDVSTGFASILDKLVIAYGYKASEGVAGWTVFNPDWVSTHPEWNTLTTLYRGRGYWIKVSEACTLIYGDNTYVLDAGWNLIGWLGW
jgi:hypothetical protein